MADVNVDQGGEQEYVSSFESEVAGNGGAAPSESTSGASPATAGLASETVGTPAAQALGGSAKGTAPEATSGQPVDLVAALEKMLAEESGQQPTAPKLSREQELAKLLEGVQAGTPADQRIRALANARSEAQEVAQQKDAQLQQFQGYFQQMQQQAQAEIARRDQALNDMRQQMQVMAANFEALKTLAPKPPVDPADQIRNQWQDGMKNVIADQRKEWTEKELAPLQKRLDAFEAREKAAESARLAGDYRSQAEEACKNVALRGFEIAPEVSQKIGPKLAAFVLADVLNTGHSYQQAAQDLRQVILQVSAAAVRAASKGAAGALKTGKEAPTTTTSRRVDGQGSAMPTLDKLHEMGFRDEMDYLAAQG